MAGGPYGMRSDPPINRPIAYSCYRDGSTIPSRAFYGQTLGVDPRDFKEQSICRLMLSAYSSTTRAQNVRRSTPHVPGAAVVQCTRSCAQARCQWRPGVQVLAPDRAARVLCLLALFRRRGAAYGRPALGPASAPLRSGHAA